MVAYDTPNSLFGNPEQKLGASEVADFMQAHHYQPAKSANELHAEFSSSNMLKEDAKSEVLKSPDSHNSRIIYQRYQEVKNSSTKVTAQILKRAGEVDSDSASSTSQEDNEVNEIVDDGAQQSSNGSESQACKDEDSSMSAEEKGGQMNQRNGQQVLQQQNKQMTEIDHKPPVISLQHRPMSQLILQDHQQIVLLQQHASETDAVNQNSQKQAPLSMTRSLSYQQLQSRQDPPQQDFQKQISSQQEELKTCQSGEKDSPPTDDDDSIEEDDGAVVSMTNIVVETSPKGRFKRFGEELGRGAYKIVYKGVDNETGREIAWNIINLNRLPNKERQRIKSEIDLIKKLEHKNIIHFITAWYNKEKEQVAFITEMITGGSLRKYVKRIKNPRLRVIKTWCKEILQGLLYLHEQKPYPIIHRDLKCDNIFINSNSGDIRIGDLGLSTPMANSYTTSVLGTPEFMAPELYEECYDTGVDIYAFGMCVIEMITLERPYMECNNPAQIYNKVIHGIRPQALERILNEEVKEFIVQCLQPKDQRPSAHDLLTSKFLNDLESETNNHEVQVMLASKAATQKQHGKRGEGKKLGGHKVDSTIFEQENEDDNSQDEREGKMRAKNRDLQGSDHDDDDEDESSEEDSKHQLKQQSSQSSKSSAHNMVTAQFPNQQISNNDEQEEVQSNSQGEVVTQYRVKKQGRIQEDSSHLIVIEDEVQPTNNQSLVVGDQKIQHDQGPPFESQGNIQEISFQNRMDVDSFNTQALPVEELKEGICLPPSDDSRNPTIEILMVPSVFTSDQDQQLLQSMQLERLAQDLRGKLTPQRHISSGRVGDEDDFKSNLEQSQLRKSNYKRRQQHKRDEDNYQFLNEVNIRKELRMLEKTFISIKLGDQDDEDDLHMKLQGAMSDPGTRKSSLCEGKPHLKDKMPIVRNRADSFIAVDGMGDDLALEQEEEKMDTQNPNFLDQLNREVALEEERMAKITGQSVENNQDQHQIQSEITPQHVCLQIPALAASHNMLHKTQSIPNNLGRISEQEITPVPNIKKLFKEDIIVQQQQQMKQDQKGGDSTQNQVPVRSQSINPPGLKPAPSQSAQKPPHQQQQQIKKQSTLGIKLTPPHVSEEALLRSSSMRPHHPPPVPPPQIAVEKFQRQQSLTPDIQPKTLQFGTGGLQLSYTDKSNGDSNSPKNRGLQMTNQQQQQQPPLQPKHSQFLQHQHHLQQQQQQHQDESFDDQTESDDAADYKDYQPSDKILQDDRQLQYNKNQVEDMSTPQFKQQSSNNQQFSRSSTIGQILQQDQMVKKSSTSPGTQTIPNHSAQIPAQLAQQLQQTASLSLPILTQTISFQGLQQQQSDAQILTQQAKSQTSTPNLQSSQRPSNLQQHPQVTQKQAQPQQVPQPSQVAVNTIRNQLQQDQTHTNGLDKKAQPAPEPAPRVVNPPKLPSPNSLPTKKEEAKTPNLNAAPSQQNAKPGTQEKDSFPETLTMIIKVKKEAPDGQEKTQEVKFEFDFTKDTPYGVATEMVSELEIGERQIIEIQKQIIQQITQKTGKVIVPQPLVQQISQLTKAGDKQLPSKTASHQQQHSSPKHLQQIPLAQPSPQTPSLGQHNPPLTTPANTPAQHQHSSQTTVATANTFTQAQQAQVQDKKPPALAQQVSAQPNAAVAPSKKQLEGSSKVANKINKDNAELTYQKLLGDISTYFYDMFALGVTTVEDIRDVMDCTPQERVLRYNLLSQILVAKRDYKKKSVWYQKKSQQTHGQSEVNLSNPIVGGLRLDPQISQPLEIQQQSLIGESAIGKKLSNEFHAMTPQPNAQNQLNPHPIEKQRPPKQQDQAQASLGGGVQTSKITYPTPQYIRSTFKSAPQSITCSQKLSKDLKRIEAHFTEDRRRFFDHTPDEEVKELQQLLNILWYDSVLIHAGKATTKEEERNIITTHVPLKVDGVFDEKTEKCVIKFQRYKEKTENGVVSERTWTLMLSQAESIVSEDMKKQRSISLNDPKVAAGQQMMNLQKEAKQVQSSNHQGTTAQNVQVQQSQIMMPKTQSLQPPQSKDSQCKLEKSQSQPNPQAMQNHQQSQPQPPKQVPQARTSDQPPPPSPSKSSRIQPLLNVQHPITHQQQQQQQPSTTHYQAITPSKTGHTRQEQELDYKGVIDQLYEKMPDKEKNKGFYLVHMHEEEEKLLEENAPNPHDQAPNEEDYDAQGESPSQQETNNLADDEYIDDEEAEDDLMFQMRHRNK